MASWEPLSTIATVETYQRNFAQMQQQEQEQQFAAAGGDGQEYQYTQHTTPLKSPSNIYQQQLQQQHHGQQTQNVDNTHHGYGTQHQQQQHQQQQQWIEQPAYTSDTYAHQGAALDQIGPLNPTSQLSKAPSTITRNTLGGFSTLKSAPSYDGVGRPIYQKTPALTAVAMSTNPTSHAPIKLVKKSTLAGKFATPIKSRTKLSPGRLFVRMPIRENDLVFELGEFTIGLAMTDIDSHIVEKARKRLEKKAEKEAKKAGGSKVGVFGLGGKRGNANDDGGDGTNEGGGVGGLEARDEIETTAENIASHQNAEAIKALEHNDLPKLASLLIQHTSSDDGLITTKTLWSSSPGINFIGATSLSSLEITPGGCMTEQFTQMYPIQTVDNIRRGPAHIITMVGQLAHKIEDGGTLPPNSPVYTLQFILEEESTRALKFVLRVEGGGNHPTGRSGAGTEASSGESGSNKKKLLRGDQLYDYTVNSVQMFVRADMVSTENGREKEAFFGLGGRYSKPNLRGLEVQVCHPSTSCNPGSAGGGDTTTSSASSGEFGGYGLKQTTNPSTLPHFVSSSGISCHLHNVEPTIFDFTNTSWYSIRSPCSNVLSGTFLCAKDMLHAMELHTGMVGRTRPLPKWTQRNGILVGMQGGSFAVQHICRNFFKYKCPLAGILIKDWTGSKATPASTNTNTYGGNGAWYNYVLEREHYTGWQPLVESLERRGISVGLYVTPYLEEIPMVLRSGRRYLFGETKSDYFVKKKTVVKVKNNSSAGDGTKDTKDSAGKKWKSKSKKKESLEVQLSMYEHFKKTNCGMLDFTNYSATSWYKSVLKEEVLDGAGASFWMADMSMGGPPIEGVYTTSLNTGLSHHNNYIEEFAEANRDAIKEAGRDGDSFFIVNSAYGSTAKYAGCTSLGDHVANFHNDTGGILRSILNGIINAGLSGLTHHHCAVNLAVPRQITNAVGNSIDSKSREMICRWLEMTAFTALFRTHDGDNGINENSGGSAKSSSNTLCAYEDEAVMRALTRWSRVFVALAEYRLQLLNEASFKGHPVVRHPILHFPFDEQFCKQEKKDVGSGNGTVSSSAFMLGDLMYVVPVVKSGVSKKKVYLPEGAWIHLWTMEQVTGPDNIGATIEVKCPVGQPPVFIRDHDDMHRVVALLRQKRIIIIKKKEKKKSLLSSFRKSKSGSNKKKETKTKKEPNKK